MHRTPLLLPGAAFLAAIIATAHGAGPSAVIVACAILFLRVEIGVGTLLGVAIGAVHGHPATIEREFATSRYAGTVVGDVRAEDGQVAFPFAIDGLGTLRALARAGDDVRPGLRLIVRARVAPIDVARNPGEPSPRELALDEGVVGQLRIGQIIARQAPDVRDPRVWMPLARERLSRLARSALPEPEATLLAGALWGERGTLPRDVRDDFQATGTVHVLVTAGLHLGVIAMLVGTCFALLRVPRIAASLATIPFIYVYAWLSGWHLPAQRAAAMITVALVARATGARTVSINTLALAAIVVAACWPVAVESASFALSFSCVAAIVLCAEPLVERLEVAHLPAALAETIALTISTQIGVWPLTAAIFSNVAPYAILANALVVPLVGVTMMVGIATIAAHPVIALSGVFAQWDCWLLACILSITHGLARLPGAHLTIAPPPIWAIAGYDAIAIVAALCIRTRPIAAAAALAIGCAGVTFAAMPRPSGQLTITALDVGQGDAIVMRTPHGRTIMIDTGGRLERGPTIDGESPAERSADRIVIPYLQRAGIARIDLLVLTHPHGDHVGGCLGIVTQFRVREIFDSGQSYGGRAYADCKRAAAERHVPIRTVRRGLRWSTDDGVSLDILAPTNSPLMDTGDDVNENSIVARLTYAREGQPFTTLFMGDAGMARESEMIEHHIGLRADLLKVGHHGSGYASTPAFIDAVKPRFAAISVGRHNLFGHPAPATIDTLRRAGAALMRTDQCGAVTLAIGGSGTTSVNTMMSCAWVPRPHR